MLSHAGNLDPVMLLVVCCVWPEAIVATQDTETFGAWLATFGSSQPDRLSRNSLGPLTSDDLGQLVHAVAPKTSPDVTGGIVELASGNPLTLSLILDLDRVKRDIAVDGRIDVDPGSLAGLPRDAEALYQELWRQLPEESRRVLAALSLQAPRFTPGWLDDFATDVGQYQAFTKAYDELLAMQSWVRPSEPPFHEFAELARHRVALDNVQQVLSDEEQGAAYRAAVVHLDRLRRDDSWSGLAADVRRVVLAHHVDLIGRLGDEDIPGGPASLSASAVELAELELDALHAERAVELARAALRAAPDDVDIQARIRRVLGNALVAAGRGAEAVPLLEQVATREPDAEVEDDLSAALEAAIRTTTPEDEAATEIVLEAWQPWSSRPVESLTSLPASAVGELITEVVSVEGPVLLRRVAYLLRSASGANRAGTAIRHALQRGVTAAVSAGTILASAPDASGDRWRRTLRTPGQPLRLRLLPPRDTWDVPAEELEALAVRVVAAAPLATRNEVKRKIATLYGWSRYTHQLDELLESLLPPDVGLPEQQAGAARGEDLVRAMAVSKGLAEDYDALLGVAARHGLDTRRWPRSTTITPPGSRQFTLVYIGVRGASIHVGYSTENLQRFLKIAPKLAETTLGQNWRDLNPGEARTYVEQLDALLADSSLP